MIATQHPSDPFQTRETKVSNLDSFQIDQSLPVESSEGVPDWQAPLDISLGNQVIDQLLEPLARLDVELQPGGVDSRKLKVQIYPEELGQVEITITRSEDGLVAQITATERVTSELLNREKEQLLEMFGESGLGSPSVEISHRQQQGNSRNDYQPETWQLSTESYRKSSAVRNQSQSLRSSSLIDVLA
jgi:flagellar hook-length control protein FliK